MPAEAKLLDRHVRNISEASILTGFQVMNPILPEEVIKILNANRINFILVGAYGLSGWIRAPRSTKDVDVLVMASHQKKAIRILLNYFPQLEADDQEVVVRFRYKDSEEDVAIDVLKINQPLYRVAFKNTLTIKFKGQNCKIPTLEMALAMKFRPMVSFMRVDEKKHLDAHDFIRMVKMNAEINLEKLAKLGDLVYPGGGKEILEKVHTIRTGGRLVL